MPKANPVLVCVTAQLRCEKLIRAAEDLAAKLNRELTVVTIQPKNAEPQQRARDLKCLNTLSKLCDCDIDIIYSDHVTTSLAAYINRCEPCHILIGNPDTKGAFFNEFMSNHYCAPVSVVDEKIIYTLPAYQFDAAHS